MEKQDKEWEEMRIGMEYFRTEELSVGYRGKVLLGDINIGIEKGKILTLVGPNGTGKSTILKTIIRQLEKIGGTVYVGKQDMKTWNIREMAKQVSVVLTEKIHPELMTCEEVVAMGRYPYTNALGKMTPEDKKVVEKALRTVHGEELAERDFSSLSDGQKQRVMLARALCQQPDIIVLDEPTSFLDIRYKLEFLSVLQEMSRKRNLTVLMSLHELDLAGRISDKIACVQGDRIDRFGTPEEIFTQGYIPQLYQMTTGSYDELTGDLELPSVQEKPEIFVIAGNGTGTSIFRRLQRERKAFATGILWENDIDFASAKSLAAEVISVPAFHYISDEQIKQTKKWINECESVICTLKESDMVGFAKALSNLAEYAKIKGKLITYP